MVSRWAVRLWPLLRHLEARLFTNVSQAVVNKVGRQVQVPHLGLDIDETCFSNCLEQIPMCFYGARYIWTVDQPEDVCGAAGG
jgi:hypothetical protein